MKMFVRAAVLAALAIAPFSASAAMVTFDLTDTQGDQSSDTRVTLEDVMGGVKFTYQTLENADIVAVYFNVIGNGPSSIMDFTATPNTVVTGSAVDTDNVQAGNIGQTFDIGLAIGSTGAGGGDFFNSFMFTLLMADLDVTDFLGQTFAVRGQSIGEDGAGSSKEYGTVPTEVIPLPASLPLLLGGLAGLSFIGRRRRAG